MTLLYRERHRLDRPPELVAESLDRELEDRGAGAVERERVADGARRWAVRRLAGAYRHHIRLDPAAGTVTHEIHAPEWFGALSATGAGALAGVALVAAGLLAVPDPVLIAALWTYAVLALFPVAPTWPDTPLAGPDLAGAGETVARRLAPVAIPPYLAVVGLLWLALHAEGSETLGAAGAVVLLAIGAGIYYAAGGRVRSDPAGDGRDRPDDTRGADDEAGVPAVGLALSALVPPLVAAGNLAVATGLVTAEAPGTPAFVLAVAFALGLDLLFLSYCRVALDRFAAARLAHVRSRSTRIAGMGAMALANALLVGITLAGGWSLSRGTTATPPAGGWLAGTFPSAGTVAAAVGWLPSPVVPAVVAAFYALIAFPLLVLVGGWAVHVGSSLVLGVLAVLWSEPVDGPAIDGTTVSVRVADLGGPVVRPVAVGPWRFVLADRSVREGLDGDAFAAVVAHEAYHLDDRGPAASILAGIASLSVGGRNALLAFYDYPAIERAADDHAARTVGTDPLVRALRDMERLRYEHGGARGGGEEGPIRRAVDALAAPSRLYFGPLLLDRAHADVDERIARLSARSSE